MVSVPARIVTIANQKGGTGKTTLTMNLAAGFARRGQTLVLDADPQQSATQWGRLAPEGRAYSVAVIPVADDLEREVERFRDYYRFILVDCPPTLETGTVHRAMVAADIVLIPVLPSPVDLWASLCIAQTVESAKQQNRDLRARLLLNQLEARNTLSHSMQEALAEFDIPALKGTVQRRAAYRNAALEGLSIYELARRPKPAVAEIDAIIEEVLML